jgi:hypothetical protein
MITRFTILALALAMSSQADTLRLRNGSTVNGSFLGGTADDIRFLVNDEVQHYARAGVAEIIFGTLDAPSAGPEATPRIDRGPTSLVRRFCAVPLDTSRSKERSG